VVRAMEHQWHGPPLKAHLESGGKLPPENQGLQVLSGIFFGGQNPRLMLDNRGRW